MKRHYVIALVSLLSVNSSTHPISEKSATYGAIGGGVAVGALSVWLTSSVLSKQAMTSYSSPATKIAFASFAGAVAGGFSWQLLNQYLQKLTPTGRIKTANELIYFVETDSFILGHFQTVDEIVSHTNGRFGTTNWPLVLAHNYCITIHNSLSTAYDLLSTAINEVQNRPNCGDLSARCKVQLTKISDFAATLDEYVNALVACKEYQFQVSLYEEHLKEEERTREIMKAKPLKSQVK